MLRSWRRRFVVRRQLGLPLGGFGVVGNWAASAETMTGASALVLRPLSGTECFDGIVLGFKDLEQDIEAHVLEG